MVSGADDFARFVADHPGDKRGDGTHMSGSSRVHHGLANPTMRGFVKEWKAANPDVDVDAWLATMDDLYGADSIDEVCMAGFMLGAYGAFRRELPLARLDTWISRLEGWREIDTTCQSNFSGAEMLARWSEWQPFLDDLSTRPSIAHRRASLVLLVKPVRDSDDARVIDQTVTNVSRLADERDKLITKAVSWVLRSAIRHHRDQVVATVDAHRERLAPVVVREVDRKLATGRK